MSTAEQIFARELRDPHLVDDPETNRLALEAHAIGAHAWPEAFHRVCPRCFIETVGGRR